MIDLLTLSVGRGWGVSLFALAAGGMIVPGYLALSLNRPLDVALTVGTGVLTFAIVHALSTFMLVYGRRRTVIMILVGYLMGAIVRSTIGSIGAPAGVEMKVIGFIIPGLIAIWLDRQGVVETLAALVSASVVVRLVLVLVAGLEFGL